MSQLAASGENAEQIEYWNGEAGDHWTKRNDQMDTMLRPLGAAAIERAAPVAGELALDIGCGCGGTTLDMVASLGPSGHILGVDISKPMLMLANKKISQLPVGLQGVPGFQLADAASFDFPPEKYDLLFSRFGVMFFADPPAAFANMRKALKPGGRVTFLCWGPPDENDWITIPLGAARGLLPPTPAMDPKAPGPFAFADRAYVEAILAAAGFSDIEFEATTPVMKLGGGGTLEETAGFFLEMGPLARALLDQPDSLRDQIGKAVQEAVADFYSDGFVELDARCWIVSARNPV